MSHPTNGNSTPQVSAESRSFAGADSVELDPIKNPTKATSATVARGVNKLHKCVEVGFADLKTEMEVIRNALRIDKDGKPLKGSKPIGLLSSWEAMWRGAFVIFGGLSATAFVWKAVIVLWPALATFADAVNKFILGH